VDTEEPSEEEERQLNDALDLNLEDEEEPEAEPDDENAENTETNEPGENAEKEGDDEITDAEFKEIDPEDYLKKKFEFFGLTHEDIVKEVPEFNGLSQGKQLLVLENLQQLTLGRVHEEAQDKYRADVQKSKFLVRIWKGVSKHLQVRKLEKATSKELLQGGIEAHGTVLKELTDLTQDMPEVEVQEDGKLAIGYASEFKNATPREQRAVRTFNQAANEFARMPEEWSFSTASKKEQKQYRAAEEEYDYAKYDLLFEKERSYGKSEKAEELAMAYVNEAEFSMRMNQFLNTHPDVEKQLQSIKNERALTKAVKDIFMERTGLFVGGAVVRSFTISTLGWIAAPIVGAGVGAWRGKAMAEETLTEREKAARKGVKDTSNEAKNIIDADKAADKLEKQTKKLITAYSSKEEVANEKELASLKARIEYARDKVNEGRVNYGSQEHRLRNRYNLLKNIAIAESMFYMHGGDATVKSQLDERLDSFLAHKEQKITKAQASYMRKQMLKGASYGAGFALAGAGIRHLAGNAAEATGLDEKLGRAKSWVWGRDEATEPPAARSVSPPSGSLTAEGSAPAEMDENVFPGSTEPSSQGTDEGVAQGETGKDATVDKEPSATEDSEIIKITDQQRIENTAKYFGFREVSDQKGVLRLDMAEAAEKNPNLGKLEQVLDRLVAAQYVDEFGEKLDPDEAAKILNMAANLRVALETNDASFMDKWTPEGSEKLSELFEESLEHDADGRTLDIKDLAKFEKLVDGLNEHADELARGGKLEGAVGEIPKVKQEAWSDIVNAAQEKEIEVEDYSQNDRVKAAYEANQARDAVIAADASDSVDKKTSAVLESTEVGVEGTKTEESAKPEAVAGEALSAEAEHIQNLLEKSDKSSEEKAIAQAIKNYNGEVVEGINVKSAQEQSAKILLESAKSGKFDEMLKYNDYKESMMNVMDNALDDEMRHGEGWRHFGSPDTEKLFDFSNKFARLHGLDEQGSKIFSSWLAGEDNILDRDDFKRLGLWAQEGDGAVKKNHFDSGAFARKVDEFEEIAKSKELPGKNWEPRTIHYADRDGVKHADVMNVRESAQKGYYELDNNGDKRPNSDPRIKNGPPWRCPKRYIENWLNEPEAEIAETDPATEAASVEPASEESTTQVAKPAPEVEVASPAEESAEGSSEAPASAVEEVSATESGQVKPASEETPNTTSTEPAPAETTAEAPAPQPAPEEVPVVTPEATPKVDDTTEFDYSKKLDSFNLGRDKGLVEKFLEDDLNSQTVKNIVRSLENIDDLGDRNNITSALLKDDRKEYIVYKIQELARRFVDNPNDFETKNALQSIIKDARKEEGDNSIFSSLNKLFKK